MGRSHEIRVPAPTEPQRLLQRLGEKVGIVSARREEEIQGSISKQVEFKVRQRADMIHRLATSDACGSEISFLMGTSDIDPHPNHEVQYRGEIEIPRE